MSYKTEITDEAFSELKKSEGFIQVPQHVIVGMMLARNGVFFNILGGLLSAHQECDEALLWAERVTTEIDPSHGLQSMPRPSQPTQLAKNGSSWFLQWGEPGYFEILFDKGWDADGHNARGREDFWFVRFSRDSSLTEHYEDLISDWRTSVLLAQKKEEDELAALRAQGRFHVRSLPHDGESFGDEKVVLVTDDPVRHTRPSWNCRR